MTAGCRLLYILALDGVVAFDLSTPLEVFGRTRLSDGQAAYRLHICAPTDEVDARTFILRAPYRLDMLAEADAILVPGLTDVTMTIPQKSWSHYATQRQVALGSRRSVAEPSSWLPLDC